MLNSRTLDRWASQVRETGDIIRLFRILGMKESDIIEKSGKSGVRVRCPFHKERTPSCVIHTNRYGIQVVHCFGCQFNGDIIKTYRRWIATNKTGTHHMSPGGFLKALIDITSLLNIEMPEEARRVIPATKSPDSIDAPRCDRSFERLAPETGGPLANASDQSYSDEIPF